MMIAVKRHIHHLGVEPPGLAMAASPSPVLSNFTLSRLDNVDGRQSQF